MIKSSVSDPKSGTKLYDVDIYLGDLQIEGTDDITSNEKIEYQIVVSMGSEDPVELLERSGRLSTDLIFGKRASTRVPSRFLNTKGKLNHFDASFHQSLCIMNAAAIEASGSSKQLPAIHSDPLFLWVIRLAFPSSDHKSSLITPIKHPPLSTTPTRSRYSTINLSSTNKLSHLSMAPIYSGEPDIVRSHPYVSLVAVAFLNPELLSSGTSKSRFNALQGKHPLHLKFVSLLPLVYLKNLNQSLPFGFIGNSGGILGEIFSESSHATTSPAESEIPIGTIGCKCILVQNNRIPISSKFSIPNVMSVNIDKTVFVRGIIVRVYRVSNMPLSNLFKKRLLLNSSAADSHLKRLPQLLRTLSNPQKLELTWQIKNDSKVFTNKATTTSKLLESLDMSQWGRKVLWSNEQVQFSPLAGTEFRTTEVLSHPLSVDLDFSQTVYMLIPPNGSHHLNCCLSLQLDDGDDDRRDLKTNSCSSSYRITSIAKPIASIDITKLRSQYLNVPLMISSLEDERDDYNCKVSPRSSSTDFAGNLHLEITYTPPNGSFFKLNTFTTIQPDPKSNIPGVYPPDLFNPPALELNPSPFSCPKYRIKKTSQGVHPSAVIPMVFKEQPVENSMSSRNSGGAYSQSNEQVKIEKRNLNESSGFGNPLHRKLNEFCLPSAKNTWIEGGNPERGIANEEQEIRIIYKQEFSKTVTTTNEIVDNTRQKLEKNLNELKELPKRIVGKNKGRYLADGLHLRLEPAIVEIECMAEVPSGKSSNLKNPILDYKIICNDNNDESCNLRFIVHNSGRFKLHIDLYGTPISGSPFNLCIVAGSPDPMASYILSPNNPRQFYASTTRIIDLKKPIQLKREGCVDRFNLDVTDFKAAIKEFDIKGKFYENEIRIQLCDSANCPLTSGGHLVSAQGSGGTEIISVVDMENGTFIIKFISCLPFWLEERKQFNPVLDIMLNGTSIYGFPMQMEPQNLNEIIEGYNKIEQLCNKLQGMHKIESLLKTPNPDQAKKAIRTLSTKDEEFLECQLRELKQSVKLMMVDDQNSLTELISEMMLNKTDAMEETGALNSKFNEVIEKLQNKWLLMQKSRSKILEIQDSLKKMCGTHQSLSFMLAKASTDVERKSLLLKEDLLSLNNFKQMRLDPCLPQYREAYYAHRETATAELVALVDAVNSNNFETLEDLLTLHQNIAQQLRQFYRFELADEIENLTPLILEKIDLWYHRSYLESKNKQIQKLDSVLSQKELNLQLATQKFKETIKSESSQESADPTNSNSNEVWEPPPLIDNVGVQTEDPYHSLDSVLGPMIVYRATGKSPFPNAPESESALIPIARQDRVGAELKRFWTPATIDEIQEIRKIFKSCPRLRVALDETFYSLSSFSLPRLKNPDEFRSHKSSAAMGIVWESYKRFCTLLKLNQLLLDDPVALRSLFMKFSFEEQDRFSSTFGFVRYIPFTLWLPLLRELAYLNTLAELIVSNRITQNVPIRRLRCFHHFIRTKFVKFYSIHLPLFSQSVYRPLAEPKAILKSPPVTPSIRITSEQRLIQSLKKEVSRLLDYNGIQRAFEKRATEKMITRKIPFEDKIIKEKVLLLSVKELKLYLMTAGLCPDHISMDECVKILREVLSMQSVMIERLRGKYASTHEINHEKLYGLEDAFQRLSLKLSEIIRLANFYE